MGSTPEYSAAEELPSEDFRIAAIRTTMQLGRICSPTWPSLMRSARSGVWLAPPGGGRVMRRMAVIGWAAIVVAMTSAGLGRVVGHFATPDEPTPEREAFHFWFLMISVMVMFGSLLVGIFLPKWMTRRAVLRRSERLGASAVPDAAKRTIVSVENAHTFEKLKITPEDFAVLMMDPSNRRIRLAGLRCIYDIDAQDVTRLYTVSSTQSTAAAIEFKLGETTLALSLNDNRLFDALKQHFGQTSCSLYSRLSDVLRLNEPSLT
jgi:hypothetical protein